MLILITGSRKGIGKFMSEEKFRKIELDTFEYTNSARAIYLELGWKNES